MKKATPHLDIVLAIPGLPFNGNTFDGQSLGGSETAGYYMAKALAKLGHRVMVFCNTPERVSCADVDYLPLGMFQAYADTVVHDVCIVQRAGEFFSHPYSARFSALWCHDLASSRAEPMIKGTAWNYDKLFVLSDFMKSQYVKTIAVPEDMIYQTRNGIDLTKVDEVRQKLGDLRHNPLSLIYTSRPERGLDVLLRDIMPRILKVEPNARLFIAGYDNQVPDMAEFYATCDAMAKMYGDHVQHLGPLTKAQLYEVYMAGGLYVYPLPSPFAPNFDEVSCITAMECQACGLPVVTSARGAMPETLDPRAGRLIGAPYHGEAYFDAFADAALTLMRNPHEWRQASQAGLERAKQLSWDQVAVEWTDMFVREIETNNGSLATLANHFYRRSDIYAAKEVLSRLPVDNSTKAIRDRIDSDYAFMTSADGFREQYEKIGATHNAEVINWSPREPRFAALLQWFQRHAEVKSALDYGCAHGGYAINLLAQLPEVSITGVDIDLHGINMAYDFAEKLGVTARWAGVVGDFNRLSDTTLPEMSRQYDAAIAQEVLEHVPDPGAVLVALEQRVKDGGLMYVTVPYGPWEYTDYTEYPYRAHLHEFDCHDLHDLLDIKGKDGEVSINSMPYGKNPLTGDSLGWWVVQYRVTAENRGKIGHIDFERKLKMQRPRQTLSVIMMAGPKSEENLHWCLRSLTSVADEVVIVDCGLSEEAFRILHSYTWRDFDPNIPLDAQRGNRHFLNIRIVPGVDPKTHGFETPRNMGIAEATQDWILWIDTDEKLLQPEKLHKYLRKNIFQGYSIRQFHFAVDTHFDPDMPVRLFRNNGKLHFFGMIHEHPEEDLNKGPGRTIVISDVHIPHLGYLIESGRQLRFNRNWPMLQADIAKYPERLLQKHFIMRDEMTIANMEISQNGGRITEATKARCEKVIALYREHFSGKGTMTNVDPLNYYSQACGMLGLGFDAHINLAADKYSAKPNGGIQARFANREDYMAELTRRANDAVSQFDREYY